MARGTRPNTKNTKPEQSATEAVTTEATKEATVTSTATEETPAEVVTDQAPAEVATDQAPAEATGTEKAVAEKPAAPDLTGFKAAVDTALTEMDTATGDLPKVQVEAVKAEYQKLDGLKAKNAAKKDLQDRLRAAITKPDVQTAAAVMNLNDNACVAGGKSASADKAQVDPAQAYVDRLVALNLAYSLAVNDVPEGVNAEEARAKAQDQVGELAESADKLYTWTKADAEKRGDEPEVNALVKRAVRLTTGKVSGGKSGGTSTPHEGPRGNVARHIRLVLKDQPVGTSAKVAEISKAKTEEYPEGTASPGAVSSRLKNGRPIEGIEATMLDGVLAAKKTAEYEAA